MLTDEMEAALDARCRECGETWDLYRGMDGEWKLWMGRKRGDDRAARTVSGATISAVLRQALLKPRLPVVPPRPVRLVPSDFQVEKQGRSTWYLHCRGSFWNVHKTRKAALELAELTCHRTAVAADEWEREWLPVVESGVEGVDYWAEESR
jgi:hypothetical protein